MRSEDGILIRAFDLGILSVEVVPPLRGARSRDGAPQVVPALVVLKAHLAGVSIRLCSIPLAAFSDAARQVNE